MQKLQESVAVRQKVSDIDSERMTLRVEQGKGQRDRHDPKSDDDPRQVAEPLAVAESSRTNVDDRLPADTLGRV